LSHSNEQNGILKLYHYHSLTFIIVKKIPFVKKMIDMSRTDWQ